MKAYLDYIASIMSVNEIIDIILVAFVIYKVLMFIRESRAEQLVKGVFILVLATIGSEIFHLYTLNWILKSAMTLGMVALVIVFQPELRRGLEYMGRSKLMKASFINMYKEKAKDISQEITRALSTFAKTKTGALIVLEQETSLTDIAETGVIIDGIISEELLGNLFYEGSPLHDGAVIIRGDKIYAGGCVLPLTENKRLPKELGTRHRAALGITEKSDALSIVVSEETGIISMAEDGKFQRFLDIKTVEKTLLQKYLENVQGKETVAEKSISFINKLIGRKKDASK